MLQTLAIANYRTLRQLVVPLGQLNVVSGANGSGKSNLYRALRLLAETGQGSVTGALAREGGLRSVLWAGPEEFSRGMKQGNQPVQGGPRREPVNLRMGFAGDEFSYAIDLGLPPPPLGEPPGPFSLDPEIKRECLWLGCQMRPAALQIDRRGPTVKARDSAGQWQIVAQHLQSFDSVLTQFADPAQAPETLLLREQIRGWRFYDYFRTDAGAPARTPQIGTRTPVLSADGHDLAAALETIREIGDAKALDAAIEDAFPGARIEVQAGERFQLQFFQHGLLRPLNAAELSDGTLRYLLLVAALLTPRPPQLMVLNEPETSLHPDLLPALAKLIVLASKHSQVWVVSHATRLIAALEQSPQCHSLQLEKVLGETQVLGQGVLDAPAWTWPSR